MLGWKIFEHSMRLVLRNWREAARIALTHMTPVMLLTDGASTFELPLAQDHKQALDGDEGPMTGGMGAVAPVPLLDDGRVLILRQYRFAIGAHRAKRSRAITASPLDEIPGIGPARKKALLQYFGSAKGVARAKLADLKEVDGVSAALAERIYGHFNSG